MIAVFLWSVLSLQPDVLTSGTECPFGENFPDSVEPRFFHRELPAPPRFPSLPPPLPDSLWELFERQWSWQPWREPEWQRELESKLQELRRKHQHHLRQWRRQFERWQRRWERSFREYRDWLRRYQRELERELERLRKPCEPPLPEEL
ncbi:hypothetical protein HRbin21_01231 [bacterium HR21]|nr:hypothetical protein HRbin21_01231 [bacterium HR21]